MQLYQVNICGVSSHAADLSVAAVLPDLERDLDFLGSLRVLPVVTVLQSLGGVPVVCFWGDLLLHFLALSICLFASVILIFLLSLQLFLLMMWIVRTQSVDVEPGQCLPSGCYTPELHSGCHRRWIIGQTVASLHIFPYQGPDFLHFSGGGGMSSSASSCSSSSPSSGSLSGSSSSSGIMEQGSWSFSGDLLSYSRSAGLGHLGDYWWSHVCFFLGLPRPQWGCLIVFIAFFRFLGGWGPGKRVAASCWGGWRYLHCLGLMNLQQRGCLDLQSVLFHKFAHVNLSLVVSAQQM